MPRRRPKAVIVDLRTAEGNDLSGVRRPSASRRATGSTLSSEEARVSQEVHDMFTGIVDDAVITNVLQQTQYDAERAVEVLFDLSSRRPPSSSTAPAAAPSAEPACTIADDEAGESSCGPLHAILLCVSVKAACLRPCLCEIRGVLVGHAADGRPAAGRPCNS